MNLELILETFRSYRCQASPLAGQSVGLIGDWLTSKQDDRASTSCVCVCVCVRVLFGGSGSSGPGPHSGSSGLGPQVCGLVPQLVLGLGLQPVLARC